MNTGALFDLVLANLGLNFEVFLIILSFLVSFLFFVKDFRIGAMTMFLLSSSVYIILRVNDLDTFLSLLFVFTSFVIMTLSLYISQSRRYSQSLY